MNNFLLGIMINTIVISKLSKVEYYINNYYTKTTSYNTSWSHNAIRVS